MVTVQLGKTGITTNKNGFGALPIQRTDEETAVRIIRRAFEGGITFFDTARFYTDSEEKLGKALKGVRSQIYLASKTMAVSAEGFRKDLEMTLQNLGTDYLDLYQFHNPAFCPKPGDESGLYDEMLKAREEGKVRHIGITNHRLQVAWEAVESGRYETLQFPFCYLSTQKELELVLACEKEDMGFIAMKALSGGLITDSKMAYAYLAQFPGVLPIWGIQKEEELEEFLSYCGNPPSMTPDIGMAIEAERKELQADFCRGCGYCMPCPVGIEINNCARMSLLLRRSPANLQLTEQVQEKMHKIKECIHCGRCSSKCPYGLDTPKLLEMNYEDYLQVLKSCSVS